MIVTEDWEIDLEVKVDIPAELQEALPVVWRSGKGSFDQKDKKLLNFSRTWLLQRTGQDTFGAFCWARKAKAKTCLDLQSPSAANSKGCLSL